MVTAPVHTFTGTDTHASHYSTHMFDQMDPESRAHMMETADHGTFEVVIIHEEHGELGTLDRTFNLDVKAGFAAEEAKIPDVGVTTEVRQIN